MTDFSKTLTFLNKIEMNDLISKQTMSGLCNDKLWHLGTWVCSAIWELFVYLFFFLQIFWLSRSKRNSDKKNSLFKQETDIIKVVTSTNGPFWAPLSNLYVRSILKVWNKVRSRKKVSYTWWRHFITNTSLPWSSYLLQWYFHLELS